MQKKQNRKTIGYTALSQYCLGCVLVCPMRCFKLLFLSTSQWFRASNCLLRLLWSKLRQLGDCAANCLFVLFFSLDVTQLFKTVVAAVFDSATHIWFKNNESRGFWLPLYSHGMFPVQAISHIWPHNCIIFFLNWGYSSWDGAIKSTRNL